MLVDPPTQVEEEIITIKINQYHLNNTLQMSVVSTTFWSLITSPS